MISLFDVNALIALAFRGHAFGESMHRWMMTNGDSPWATCPISENGFVRIVSQPNFPQYSPDTAPAKMLAVMKKKAGHVFWPDSISIADGKIFNHARILGHRQITDAYLLALAVRNGGRLVTFDRSMTVDMVKGATPENLVTLTA